MYLMRVDVATKLDRGSAREYKVYPGIHFSFRKSLDDSELVFVRLAVADSQEIREGEPI